MKSSLRHPLAAAVVAFVAFAALVALASACNHPQKRNDWRSPSPPTTCASDTDCPGSTCAIELGATQGTCTPSPSGALPPLPGADGGAHTPSPARPDIQPSSSDIQL